MTDKQFLLFRGQILITNAANGGMDDYFGRYGGIDAALSALKNDVGQSNYWAHIADIRESEIDYICLEIDEGEIVYDSRNENHDR